MQTREEHAKLPKNGTHNLSALEHGGNDCSKKPERSAECIYPIGCSKMCFCLGKRDVKVPAWSSHSWLVAQNKRWLSCLFTLDPVEARRDVYRKCSTLGIVQRPAARAGRLYRFPVTPAWWKVSFSPFSSSDATSLDDIKASSLVFVSLKPFFSFFWRPWLQVGLACARFSPSFVTLAAATSPRGALHVYVPFVTV